MTYNDEKLLQLFFPPLFSRKVIFQIALLKYPIWVYNAWNKDFRKYNSEYKLVEYLTIYAVYVCCYLMQYFIDRNDDVYGKNEIL